MSGLPRGKGPAEPSNVWMGAREAGSGCADQPGKPHPLIQDFPQKLKLE
jgi:hypothetical protein